MPADSPPAGSTSAGSTSAGKASADRAPAGNSPAAHGDRGGFAHEALAVVFQVRAGTPSRLRVLLWRRTRAPQRGRWALPGGPLGADELLGASVARHLATMVSVDQLAHLEQLETRSDPHRDPRLRLLATAYLGLLPASAEPRLPAGTAWHPLDDLPPLAFDHGSVINSARDRLRAKLSYSTIAYALAPAEFTIATLRDLYCAVLGYEVSATNLQRVLARRGAIEATGALRSPGTGGGPPARTYRFAHPYVQVTDAFAAFRPPGHDTDPDAHQPG